MQAIKPLSAESIAVSASKYPALAMAFLPSGINGSVLTDVLGNVVVTLSGDVWAQPAAGQFRRGASGTIASVAGTLPAMGTSDFIAIAAGLFNSGTINTSLGDITTDGVGIDIRGGSSTGLVLNATNYHTTGALATVAQTEVLALTRSGNTSVKYGATASVWNTPVNGVATLEISTSGGALDTANWAFTSNASSYYSGIYLLKFASGLPSAADIKLALLWMAKNPGELPPWWVGKA